MWGKIMKKNFDEHLEKKPHTHIVKNKFDENLMIDLLQ